MSTYNNNSFQLPGVGYNSRLTNPFAKPTVDWSQLQSSSPTRRETRQANRAERRGARNSTSYNQNQFQDGPMSTDPMMAMPNVLNQPMFNIEELQATQAQRDARPSSGEGAGFWKNLMYNMGSGWEGNVGRWNKHNGQGGQNMSTQPMTPSQVDGTQAEGGGSFNSASSDTSFSQDQVFNSFNSPSPTGAVGSGGSAALGGPSGNFDGGTPLNRPSPFGEKYQSYESLLSLRNQLSQMRDKSNVGERLSIDDLEALTGMTQFDPNHRETIEKAQADNFNAPIAYIDAMLDRENRMAESQASNAQSNPFGGSGNVTDPLQLAAMGVLSQLSGARGEAFANTISSYMANGLQEQAKTLIRNTAISTLPTAKQDQFATRDNIRASLNDLRGLTTLLEEKGIPTNVLTGTKEKVLRFLGNTNDPDILAYSTIAQNALDLLSRDRTGAAMTPDEETFYARMFPSVGNVAEVNNQLIDTMFGIMDNAEAIDLGYLFDPYAAQQLGLNTQVGNQYNSQAPSGGGFDMNNDIFSIQFSQ